MTREDLANQLVHTKNNYIFGLAAFTILSSEESYPLLASHRAAFGNYTVSFDQIVTLFQNSKDRKIVLNEFLKMCMRTIIKESFEHIKDYCEHTDQYAALKSEPWYEFARMIRNFLSHNCKFEFNKYDKARLPINWGDKIITIEMDCKSLDFSFFGEVETWELFQEFESFVSQRLK